VSGGARGLAARFVLAACGVTTVARAAPVGPTTEAIAVVGLEADTAQEHAAKTLTNVLRGQVLDSDEYTLGGESRPLVTMAYESKCKLKLLQTPFHDASDLAFDAACLKRMAARLGVKRYFWGYVYNEGGKPYARVHFWQEGEPDRVLTLPYEPDRRLLLGERLFRKLAIPQKVGDVTLVGPARLSGELYVDGQPRGPYVPSSELTLREGEHEVEVRDGAKVLANAPLRIVAGRRAVALLIEPEPAPPPLPAPAGSTAVEPSVRGGARTTWGWVAVGAGAAAIGAGVFSSLRVSAIDDQFVSEAPYVAYRRGAGAGDACDAAAAGTVVPQAGAASPERVKRRCDEADAYQALQFVFYGVGALAAGAGTYLLLTAPKGASATAKPLPRQSLWWRPEASARGLGLSLGATFLPHGGTFTILGAIMKRRAGLGLVLRGLALLAGLAAPACFLDSSFLGCGGLSGEELARCEAANGGTKGAGGGQGEGGAAGAAGGGGSGPTMGSAGLGGSGSGGNGGVTCETPETLCGEACKNTQTDAEHCGACDYACGTGSTCTDGVCSPVAVVSGVVAPYAFALDAQNVYFTVPVKGPGDAVPPAVQKVARSGGSPAPVFAGSIFRSRSLALTNGTLFFGDLDNAGVLRKGATTGGDVTTHLANQPAVQQLVAADGRLWWSTFDGTSRLRRASTTGTPTAAEELLPGPSFTHFGRVPALAVEGTGAAATAFWVNAGGSVTTDQGLWRKAGATAPVKLVAGGAMATLALGGGEVFVADRVTGIGKVAVGAMPPATLTSVVPSADMGGLLQGVAVAGGKLYWLAFNAGQLELHRSGLDGTEARVLGRVAAKSAAYWGAPIGPAQLTVDGSFVYFSDPGTVTGNTSASNPGLEGVTGSTDGAIYRLPE
jgi:hypothetical protein